MRAIDVLTNRKNFDCWSFKHYPLSEEEASVCIKALEEMAKNTEIEQDTYERAYKEGCDKGYSDGKFCTIHAV